MPEPVPTLKTIAAKAGVSAMAVSLALRDSPRVSAAERTRIRGIAEGLGYRPDPLLGRLMAHLARRRGGGVRAALCALLAQNASNLPEYPRRVVAGAKRRAELLGYSLETVYLQDPRRKAAGLDRLLRHRGIQGVLVTPTLLPEQRLAEVIDWSRVAAVATTHSVPEPILHRVVPDQFGNMLTTCRELTRRGYRRIGLVSTVWADLRTRHHDSAAHLWHATHEAAESVPPLVETDGALPGLSAWLRRERPDVLIAPELAVVNRAIRRLPFAAPPVVGFLPSEGAAEASLLAHMDQQAEQIGALGVEMLARQITANALGLPAQAQCLMVAGRFAWRE